MIVIIYRHCLWVETEFDSDHDRKRDRVHVDVTRKVQTNAEGLRGPVIYESFPYFAGAGDGLGIDWDVHQDLKRSRVRLYTGHERHHAVSSHVFRHQQP
jgi:hypothetical protein